MICALAVAVALTAPAREALIGRWLAANPAHTAAQLESHGAAGAPPRNLSALAKRELSTPGRYQLSQPAVAAIGEPWWARALDWIADRWQQLWQRLFGRVHVNARQAAGVGYALLVLVGLGLLAVVVLIVRAVARVRSRTSLASQRIDLPPDPQARYKEACDAASHGDYGAASLLLFGATIALLALRGTVAVRRSATVGDLRRGLRTHDVRLIPPFDTVAGTFVERAYAERAVDESRWRQARDAFDVLRAVLCGTA